MYTNIVTQQVTQREHNEQTNNYHDDMIVLLHELTYI